MQTHANSRREILASESRGTVTKKIIYLFASWIKEHKHLKYKRQGPLLSDFEAYQLKYFMLK